MLKHGIRRPLLLTVAILVPLTSLVGCLGGTPPELTAADQAIAAARQAGKDRDCPDEFNAAEKLKIQAFALSKPCDNKKAIAMANESLARTKALCPPKPAPAPTPVAVKAPPVAPAASVSLAANPASIKQGECSTLTWTSANASSASIDQGVGGVEPSGSRKVCPDKTTQYAITASGAGGSGSASTTVTVAPKVIDRMALHVNFDFDKSNLDKADEAELTKGREFLQKYPGFKVSLEGYTDSIGSDAYNQKLSERRAAAVKDWLVKKGVDASKIQTSGHGKANPVADNKTSKGRAENRRVEVLVLSE